MKKLLLIFALGLFPLTAAMADSWITWKPSSRGFSVLLPAAPQSRGNNQWQAFDSLKRLYGVVVQSATPGLEPSQEQLEAIMEGVARQTNGTVKEKRFFKYKDFQACDFKVATLASQIAATRIVVTPHSRFVLSFVSNTRNFDEGTLKKFFNSLQITLLKPTPVK